MLFFGCAGGRASPRRIRGVDGAPGGNVAHVGPALPSLALAYLESHPVQRGLHFATPKSAAFENTQVDAVIAPVAALPRTWVRIIAGPNKTALHRSFDRSVQSDRERRDTGGHVAELADLRGNALRSFNNTEHQMAKGKAVRAVKCFDDLPNAAHVDIRTLAVVYGGGVSTMWARIRRGDPLVPKPRKFGSSTRFRVGDIRKCLANAGDDHEPQ